MAVVCLALASHLEPIVAHSLFRASGSTNQQQMDYSASPVFYSQQPLDFTRSTVGDVFSWSTILNAAELFNDTLVRGMAHPEDSDSSVGSETDTGNSSFTASSSSYGCLEAVLKAVNNPQHASATVQATTDVPEVSQQSDESTEETDLKRFPVHPKGRCNHTEHHKHLRGKRRYAYYSCTLCGVEWCKLRPKFSERKAARKAAA